MWINKKKEEERKKGIKNKRKKQQRTSFKSALKLKHTKWNGRKDEK